MSQDLRQFSSEKQSSTSELTDPKDKLQTALTFLQEEYSWRKRNLPKSLGGGGPSISSHEDFNLIQITHWNETEIPYPIQASINRSDCIITHVQRESKEHGRIKTTIHAGPEEVVNDGDTVEKLKPEPEESTPSPSASETTVSSPDVWRKRRKDALIHGVLAMGAMRMIGLPMVETVVSGESAVMGETMAQPYGESINILQIMVSLMDTMALLGIGGGIFVVFLCTLMIGQSNPSG